MTARQSVQVPQGYMGWYICIHIYIYEDKVVRCYSGALHSVTHYHDEGRVTANNIRICHATLQTCNITTLPPNDVASTCHVTQQCDTHCESHCRTCHMREGRVKAGPGVSEWASISA